MSVLQSSDIFAGWAAKLQAAAAARSPGVSFDGRASLPTWLAETAQDQAERVILMLDATPVAERFIEDADALIQGSGMLFLEAWGRMMVAFHADAEPWAAEAAQAAVEAYHARLRELGPALTTRGEA